MTPAPFRIGTRTVGDGYPCFLIAEIGSNHNHDFDLARRLIDAAAVAGVDAVKFQTFKASEHYSRFTPGFNYLGNIDTFELIASLELDRSWQERLLAHAIAVGVEFFSSPCDREAIAQLAAMNAPAMKVASFDMTDTGLVGAMARTGAPVILSTGMANHTEIEAAVAACRTEGNEKIALLQCTSLYPAPPHLSNLNAMAQMRARYDVHVGYSDHTLGDHISIAAVAMGARIIEKHFTLDRDLPGPDHPFAIEPDELADMVAGIRDVEAALGDGEKNGPREEEREMFEKGRRSLHARIAIEAGEVITEDKLVVKRPGLGIPPSQMRDLIGRTAAVRIEPDHWITWDMV